MPDVKIVGGIRLPTADGKNILFLGDGFSGNDRKLFFDVVEEFALRFFRFVGPFNLAGRVAGERVSVRDKFNIFAAFTPSPSSGISSAWPVNANGEPVDPNAPSAGILADKRSFFGLQYEDGGFYPKANYDWAIVSFVDALTLPGWEHGGTAIPDCWNVVDSPSPTRPYLGKDRGLIVVLVNDDIDGGNVLTLPPPHNLDYACAVSIRPGGERFNIGTGVQNPSGVTEFPHSPVKRMPRRIAGRRRHPRKYNQINDVIAHELGHSRFGLADEYVGGEPYNPNAGSPTNDYGEPNVTAEDYAQNILGDFVAVKWRGDMPQAVRQFVETSGPLHTENCSNLPSGDLPTVGSPPPKGPLCTLFRNTFGLKLKRPLETIALYEGARYQHCGIYRPAAICKMRTTAEELSSGGIFRARRFCYVCKKAIIQDIDPNLVNLLKRKQYPR
jgi:hypothetical protein